MRIAVLTNAYPPEARGGAGRIAQIQAEWLASHGHEVCVFVPEPFLKVASGVELRCFAPRTKVPFALLPTAGLFSRLRFHLQDLRANDRAVQAIQTWKPDVLITHNVTGCGFGTPTALQAKGIRWGHVLHDVQIFEPSGQIQYQESFVAFWRVWRRFWASKRAKFFGKPDVVISPSSWLLKAHQYYGFFHDVKKEVVANPVKFNLKIQDARRKTQAASRDTGYGIRDVLYIGRVSEEKGVGVLLEAWDRIKDKPGKLVVVGDGPMLSYLQSLQDPSIEVVGPLDHDQVERRLAQASLLVFPSLLLENQPTVLLEAVAAGVPIVASDVGGVSELLGDYGTIISPGDPTALADAIISELKKPMNTSERERILSEHELDRSMKLFSENLCSPSI